MILTNTRWSNLKYAIWILTPSVVFSLAFKGIFICADPFFFPLLERYVKQSYMTIGKVIWLVLFAISLFYGWNISPRSYYFFVSEALLYSPPTVLVEVLAFVLVLGLMIFYIPKNSSNKMLSLVIPALGLVFVLLKALSLQFDTLQQYTGISVRSSVVTDVRAASEGFPIKAAAKNDEMSVGQSYFNKKKLQPVASVNEVLMLVESWGEKSGTLESMVGEINRSGIKVAQYGFVPYSGSTLNAEFRELCSKNVTLTGSVSDTESPLLCAPSYLKERGYRVFGFHGYSGRFYARNIMWKRFGIESRNFLNDASGRDSCRGIFVGSCDSSLIKAGLDNLDDRTPTFVYLLTLSSHEPVWQSLLSHDATYFGTIPAVADAQIVARNAVSSLITQVMNKRFHACTSIYIVGDHQPPSVAERGVFEKNRVPFIQLQANCGESTGLVVK